MVSLRSHVRFCHSSFVLDTLFSFFPTSPFALDPIFELVASFHISDDCMITTVLKTNIQ